MRGDELHQPEPVRAAEIMRALTQMVADTAFKKGISLLRWTVTDKTAFKGRSGSETAQLL